MTEHDCRRMRIAKDSVGTGSYTSDSHNVQRYITKTGCVQNEGNIVVSPREPYAISYRSIVPKKFECENLLVPVCISSSHIASGSIRMEPVFMVLGQSAAIAAAKSLNDGVGLHDINYSELEVQLENNDQRLDVDTDLFPVFPADREMPAQRIIHASEPRPAKTCIVRPENL